MAESFHIKSLKDSNASPFLFLINKKSGTKKHLTLSKALGKVDKSKVDVVETKSKEHALELCNTAIKEGRKHIIAVGGDGTVNSVGNALIHSNTSLGILPTGSGNGIARHLGISMNITQALDQVLKGHCRCIDTISINGQSAIGFAGIGFDAYVAQLFDQHHARGFNSYLTLTLKAYKSYKSTVVGLNDEPSPREIFDLIIANTSQLGNNAYVNPAGVDDDGRFELLNVNRPTPLQIPQAAYQLFNKKITESKLVRFSQHSELHINNMGKAHVHIDGEPCGQPDKISLKIQPKSLNVITGTNVE